MSAEKYKVVPTSLDVANSVASVSMTSMRLSLNERCRTIIGVVMNAVILPPLRTLVNLEMKRFYQELVMSKKIQHQTKDRHLKNDPGNKSAKFNYESLSVNQKKRSKKFFELSFKVDNHNELAKLYVLPAMAKFKTIETCDASAISGIIERASCFDRELQDAAKKVRQVRNDWAHSEEDKWDEMYFLESFDRFEHLMEAAGCDAKNLETWKKNGLKFIFGDKIERQVLLEVVNAVKMMHDQTEANLSTLLQKVEAEIVSKLSDLSSDVVDVKHLALTNQSRIENLEQSFKPPTKLETQKPTKDFPNQNLKFTGRHEAMKELKNWINSTEKIFGICGLGGIGKTTLAVEATWRWQQSFPGGIFWLTADDSASKDDVNLQASLKRFCLKNKLSLSDALTIDVATDFFATLSERSLVVIDNLDQEEFSSWTNKLVNGRWIQNDSAKLLITTRLENGALKEKLNTPVTTFTLEGFNSSEGGLYLERRTGKPFSDDFGQKISDELGGLPLALEQAGSFISVTKCSYEAYFKKLQQKRLEILNKGKAGPRANEDVLQKSKLAVSTTWNIHMDWMEVNSYPGFYAARILSFLPALGVSRVLLNDGSPRIDNENVANALSDELEAHEVVSILKLFSLIRWVQLDPWINIADC